MREQQENKSIPVSIFISYAHEDELLRQQLDTHLSLLRQQGLIADWHDRQILAGDKWAQEIDHHLETASIILLLISPDFLASDYCYDIEMQRALERHKRGEARVIPIILRPCDWRSSPFAHLHCLPRDGKAATTWENQDEAFLALAQGLRRVIEWQQVPVRPLPEVERKNRTRLLKRVQTTWIESSCFRTLRTEYNAVRNCMLHEQLHMSLFSSKLGTTLLTWERLYFRSTNVCRRGIKLSCHVELSCSSKLIGPRSNSNH